MPAAFALATLSSHSVSPQNTASEVGMEAMPQRSSQWRSSSTGPASFAFSGSLAGRAS